MQLQYSTLYVVFRHMHTGVKYSFVVINVEVYSLAVEKF